MGRKIYDEDLRLNLILNGQGLNQGSKQMVVELGKMEMKMIRLEQEAKKLASEIKLLAKDEAGNAGKLVTLRKAYADTTQEIRAQAVAIEKLRQKVGLAGMTVQQLKNHAKALQVQVVWRRRGKGWSEQQPGRVPYWVCLQWLSIRLFAW